MKKLSIISLVMGSQSDWKTLSSTAKVLSELKVPFEKKLYQPTGHQKDFIKMQSL